MPTNIFQLGLKQEANSGFVLGLSSCPTITEPSSFFLIRKSPNKVTNLTNFHLWIHLTAKSHKNYWTPSMKLDEGCVSTQNSLSDSSTWARQGVFSSCFKELCMGIESEYELRRYALYWLPFFLQTSSVTWSTRRDLFTLWFLNFKNYMWESQYGLEDI